MVYIYVILEHSMDKMYRIQVKGWFTLEQNIRSPLKLFRLTSFNVLKRNVKNIFTEYTGNLTLTFIFVYCYSLVQEAKLSLG